MTEQSRVLDRFCRQLVGGLQDVVAKYVTLTVDSDGTLSIQPHRKVAAVELFVGTIVTWRGDGEIDRESMLHAARSVLSTVQDVVVEETGKPWPQAEGEGPNAMPLPHGEIVDDELRLWYGNAHRPATPLIRIRI